jgi:hypothetical protein
MIIAAILPPVPQYVALIAILVVAVVFGVGGLLLWRGGKKKGTTTAMPGSGADWQRQAAQNAWSQPGSSAGWGQQAQQPGWGQQPAWGQQAQQQPAWGQQAPAAQQPAWGAQQDQMQQPAWGQQAQQQPAWGQQAPAAQQPVWGAQQQPAAQQPAWGQQDQQQSQNAGLAAWGGQSAQPASPWDQAKPAAPQDVWGQAQAQQPVWGQQAQPQPQTTYGGNQPVANQGGWGQPQSADPWAAPAVAPAGSPSGPAWPQQGGFGNMPGAQPEPAASPFGSGGLDSERTVLRTPGQQQGTLGIVRVEEGKEPGRVYEVRKDTLSIGRSRDSDIFLEDLAVSRLHASIVNMGNGNYALKDEGSANGTKVNGTLLNKYQTYPLQEGDRVQLGQTVLVFGKR